jgi:hypothetical protein
MALKQTPILLSKDEVGLLLHWMYRAQASGPAASIIIRKLQDARKQLKLEALDEEKDAQD